MCFLGARVRALGRGAHGCGKSTDYEESGEFLGVPDYRTAVPAHSQYPLREGGARMLDPEAQCATDSRLAHAGDPRLAHQRRAAREQHRRRQVLGRHVRDLGVVEVERDQVGGRADRDLRRRRARARARRSP